MIKNKKVGYAKPLFLFLFSIWCLWLVVVKPGECFPLCGILVQVARGVWVWAHRIVTPLEYIPVNVE